MAFRRCMEERMNQPSVAAEEPGAHDPTFTSYPNRDTLLGHLSISRALPLRQRRTVGP
jgi:hypothetical protein